MGRSPRAFDSAWPRIPTSTGAPHRRPRGRERYPSAPPARPTRRHRCRPGRGGPEGLARGALRAPTPPRSRVGAASDGARMGCRVRRTGGSPRRHPPDARYPPRLRTRSPLPLRRGRLTGSERKLHWRGGWGLAIVVGGIVAVAVAGQRVASPGGRSTGAYGSSVTPIRPPLRKLAPTVRGRSQPAAADGQAWPPEPSVAPAVRTTGCRGRRCDDGCTRPGRRNGYEVGREASEG